MTQVKNKKWKNKNPKIKCFNCVFNKNCKGKCTYLSIKQWKQMRRHERVREGFKLRPEPFGYGEEEYT